MSILFAVYTFVMCVLLLWISALVFRSGHILRPDEPLSSSRMIWFVGFYLAMAIYSYVGISTAIQGLGYSQITSMLMLKIFLVYALTIAVALIISYYLSYVMSRYIFRTSTLIRDLEEQQLSHVLMRTICFFISAVSLLPLASYSMIVFFASGQNAYYD